MPFDSLVEDVLLQILLELSVEDVLAIRQTSKSLASVSKSSTVWRRLLTRTVVDEGLPVPGTPVEPATLSGEDIEWRTRHALRLEKRWSMGQPLLTSSTHTELPNVHGPVNAMLFIEGGDILLTVHGPMLVYWDLGTPRRFGGQIRKVACWAYGGSTEGDIAVHHDKSRFDRIAVSSAEGSDCPVNILEIGAFRGQDTPPFREVGACTHEGKLVALHDDRLYFEIPSTGFQVVCWSQPEESPITLRYPPGVFEHIADESPLTAIHFIDEYVLVFWRTLLAIFPSATTTLPLSEDASDTVDPIRLFAFRTPFAEPISFANCKKDGLPSDLAHGGPPLTIIGASLSGTGVLQSSLHTEVTRLVPPPTATPSDSASAFWTLDFNLRARGFMPLQHGLSALCIGSSGRGVCIDGQMLGRSRPRAVIDFSTTAQELRMAEFFPRRSKVTCVKRCGRVAAFDEGMGRLALRDEEEPERVVVVDFI